MSKALSFDEVVGHLRELGVRYTQDYDYGKQGTAERHRFKVPILTGVTFPFTPEVWCALCMSEGDFYVGGCCGTSSATQDKIDYAFRIGGGHIDAADFQEMAYLLENHDQMDDYYVFGDISVPLGDFVAKAVSEWDGLGPWQKIAVIWALTKPYLRHKDPDLALSPRRSDVENAIDNAGRVFQAMSYERLFNADKPRGVADKVARSLALARVIPIVKVLWEKLGTMYEGPVEGFAVIRKDQGPEALAETSLGYAVFETKEEVEELIQKAKEQESHYEERSERLKPVEERLGIRRVRVTLDKGIEFLD